MFNSHRPTYTLQHVIQCKCTQNRLFTVYLTRDANSVSCVYAHQLAIMKHRENYCFPSAHRRALILLCGRLGLACNVQEHVICADLRHLRHTVFREIVTGHTGRPGQGSKVREEKWDGEDNRTGRGGSGKG